jgi:uncharacterized protein YndB with AHSA1/START domain
MAKTAEAQPLDLPPVRVSRTLHAPREVVFKAWSSAEHVKRWFAPTGYSVPQATVDMRVGGAFEILMRAPDGVEHWVRGVFVEITPNERLELDLIVYENKRNPLFRAMTEARFADALGGTRLEVAQGATSCSTPSRPGWLRARRGDGRRRSTIFRWRFGTC